MIRLVALLSFLLVTAAVARAADPAAAAREHFRKGTTLYDIQRYNEAAVEYEEAYALKPDPALLYNIGQAYRLGNNYDKAIAAYQSFLRRVPKSPLRPEVEGRIEALQKAAADEKGRTVERPTVPTTPLADQSIPTTVLSTREVQKKQAAASDDSRKWIIAGAVTTAAGFALAMTGVGFLGRAAVKTGEFENHDPPLTFNSPQYNTLLGKIDTFNATGGALLGVGAAAMGAGIGVLAYGLVKKKRAQAPTTFAPMLSPHAAGAAFAFDF